MMAERILVAAAVLILLVAGLETCAEADADALARVLR